MVKFSKIRRVYLGLAILISLVSIGLAIYIYLGRDDAGNSSLTTNLDNNDPEVDRVPFDDLYDSNEDDSKLDDILKMYGDDYETKKSKLTEVYNDNPTWDQNRLDDAYFVLLYADSVGDFTQVDHVLALLEMQNMYGVKIDDNNFNIDAAKREEILKRSIDYRSSRFPGAGAN